MVSLLMPGEEYRSTRVSQRSARSPASSTSSRGRVDHGDSPGSSSSPAGISHRSAATGCRYCR